MKNMNEIKKYSVSPHPVPCPVGMRCFVLRQISLWLWKRAASVADGDDDPLRCARVKTPKAEEARNCKDVNTATWTRTQQ